MGMESQGMSKCRKSRRYCARPLQEGAEKNRPASAGQGNGASQTKKIAGMTPSLLALKVVR